jgi:carbamoylphosphate synthase large subunit
MTTIVIYGTPAAHWMQALHPQSNLWSKIDRQTSVLITKNNQKIESIKDKVVIPLYEEDVLACPFESLKPDNDIIKVFQNKRAFKDFLKINNIHHYAKDYTIEDVEFPAILKRTDLVKGKGIFVIQDMEELQARLSMPLYTNQEYIIEKYIPTHYEPVTWMVCKDGEVLWHKSLQWSKDTSPIIKTGAESGGKEYNPSELTIEVFKQVVKISNYSGPIAFNYKMFEDKPVIFEVNPRLGGTLMLEENMHILAEAINTIVEAHSHP